MSESTGEAVLPDGLRDRVLTSSWQARSVGVPAPVIPEITPHEAFARAADAFYGLLGTLDPADWQVPALRDLDVQGVVGHLIGVEEDMQRSLAADSTAAEIDHVASTHAATMRQRGRSPADTRAEWRRAAELTASLVESVGVLDAPVALHRMQLTLGDLLIVRAFELWTHENDIRRSIGRPPSVPDGSTLHLMTGLAARALPGSADRCAPDGQAERIDLHLVLIGPGGGTWDVRIGSGRSRPAELSIVADVIGFCQLAADRVTAAELDVHVTGDADRTPGVLAAVAALALD